ncbi:hypothetical protein GGS20DRAFT_587496 [Poronia punctata]|nr:hypothetical protein GGS20DRAFT_587496 [Poronia punctata]
MASRYGKYGNGIPTGPASNPKETSTNTPRTVTALNRWSILSDQLPAIDKINVIHIYDFDNTLFQTPLPNPGLWHTKTLGRLGNPDIFLEGGWWHDNRILAATGDGAEQEEPRAWNGWWNEKIVELVQLSMKQKDALCVLLTGRSELGFSDLVKRMVTSKGLQFDMIGLKPQVGPNNERFKSTMAFKQAFLKAVMETYKQSKEIRIYEDRPKHVAGFRRFLEEYNTYLRNYRGKPPRSPIIAEVIQVADISTNLDPVVEVAEVQHLINNHNAMVSKRPKSDAGERLFIRKTVLYTGYLIKPEDAKRLTALVSGDLPKGELKSQSNAIVISRGTCPPHLLEKAGGLGAKLQWKVMGIGAHHNICAVSVQPVPASAPYHTDSDVPCVIIAMRWPGNPWEVKNIQQWRPIPQDQAFTFNTEVGEKVILSILPDGVTDEETEGGDDSPHYKGKRKYTSFKDDHHSRGGAYGNGGGRGHHAPNYRGRGGGGGGRGGGFGGGASNRGHRNPTRGRGGGRGGRGYRSLDDLGPSEGQGGVSYDDNFPALGNNYQSQQGPPSHYNQPPHHQQNGGQWQSHGGQGGHYNNGPSGSDFQKFY